jgi:hypothetical protein
VGVAVSGSDVDLTFYKTGSTVDAGIGTTGVVALDAAADDTFIELAARIAANDNWEMQLVGATGAALTDHVLALDQAVAGAAAGTEGGALLLFDTTAALKVTACIGLESETGGRFLSRRSDATVFDTVRDTATFSHPHQFAEGFDDVWINGRRSP